jgi:hypothetical protein
MSKRRARGSPKPHRQRKEVSLVVREASALLYCATAASRAYSFEHGPSLVAVGVV